MSSINFVGTGVTATAVGTAVTVTVPGGGSSGGFVSTSGNFAIPATDGLFVKLQTSAAATLTLPDITTLADGFKILVSMGGNSGHRIKGFGTQNVAYFDNTSYVFAGFLNAIPITTLTGVAGSSYITATFYVFSGDWYRF